VIRHRRVEVYVRRFDEELRLTPIDAAG
jgi:hypothetical protein